MPAGSGEPDMRRWAKKKAQAMKKKKRKKMFDEDESGHEDRLRNHQQQREQALNEAVVEDQMDILHWLANQPINFEAGDFAPNPKWDGVVSVLGRRTGLLFYVDSSEHTADLDISTVRAVLDGTEELVVDAMLMKRRAYELSCEASDHESEAENLTELAMFDIHKHVDKIHKVEVET